MDYVFEQRSGDTVLKLLVTNPQTTDGGVLHATKIAQFNGFDNSCKPVFTTCEPCDFIAGGGPWTLTEFKGILKK